MEQAKLVIAIEGEDGAHEGAVPSTTAPRAEYPPVPPPFPFPDPRTPPPNVVPTRSPAAAMAGTLPPASALSLDQIRRALIESPGAKKNGFMDSVSLVKDEALLRSLYEQFAASMPTLTGLQFKKMFPDMPGGFGAGAGTGGESAAVHELKNIGSLLEQVKAQGGFGTRPPSATAEAWRQVQANARSGGWSAPEASAPAQPSKAPSPTWNMPADRPTMPPRPAGSNRPFDWGTLSGTGKWMPQGGSAFGLTPPTFDPADALPTSGPTRPTPTGARPGWSGAPVAPVAGPRPVAYPVGTSAINNLIPAPIRSAAAGMGFNTQAAAGQIARTVGPGAAAMAGPAAGIFLVAELASRKIASDFNKTAEKVERFGGTLAKFAANDHLGMMDDAVHHVTESLEEIPILGRVLAAEVRAVVAPFKAVAAVSAAFAERARQLQSFNGALAASQAAADNRSYMGDLRESNRLGGTMAKFVEAQSKAEDTMRELLLPIKDILLKSLTGLMIGMEKGLELAKEIRDGAANNSSLIIQSIGTIFGGPAGGGIGAAIDKIAKKLLSTPSEPAKDPMNEWLNAADGLGLQALGNGGDEARRAVGGPIFPGFNDFAGA